MLWIAALCLSSPFLCMIVLVIVAFIRGITARSCRKAGMPQPGMPRRTCRIGAAYALGAAFLVLSMFYRPRLELAVAARILEEEKDDDNDQGDPESPVRHLLRQLRRVRRGETVDRLVWRLE